MPIPLCEGVSRAENTIDLVKITTLEVIHHLLEETLPLGRKILTAWKTENTCNIKLSPKYHLQSLISNNDPAMLANTKM